LRPLLIAKGEGDPAFGPTTENIHAGDYPLRITLYVAYRAENAEKLAALLPFFWSDEAKGALTQGASLVVVPTAARP
jgi:phosphate transport system substrate-binding protein